MAMRMKHWIQWALALVGVAVGTGVVRAAALDLPILREPAWIELSGDGGTNQLHVLEQSGDLQQWSESAGCTMRPGDSLGLDRKRLMASPTSGFAPVD